VHSNSHSADTVRDLLAVREIPRLGEVGLARARAEHGSASAVLASQAAEVRTRAYDAADRIVAETARLHAHLVTVRSADYPFRLAELSDAPEILFAKGAMAIAEAPAVAIVGARRATGYGLRVARALATTCARAGIAVVSGMAHGIDGAAHEAALAAGGRTVGVLGTGLNVVYPRQHRELQARVGEEGLLLSELAPDRPGHGGSFPRRNRIIAALAEVTVVVEAGEGSGALITANYAQELNRRVAVVPNAIDIPTSKGSNLLLKEGAEPLLEPEDLLAMLELRGQPTASPILDGDAATCWHALMQGADDIAAVARLSSVPTRVAAAAVTALELEGLVQVDATGRIRQTIAAASLASLVSSR
jgi:DNA processing protein